MASNPSPDSSGALGAGRPLRVLPEDQYVDFLLAGEGGMGVVYQAFDTDLNRVVAFKIVKPLGGEGAKSAMTPATPLEVNAPGEGETIGEAFEGLRARFLQEAWVTGRLEHPGVVPVYSLGQTERAVPYYTMRFVHGQRSLADAIDEVRTAAVEDRLALLEPFLKVCDTVRYAHSKGVLHRDLKPSNIALGEYGEVVVLDWGLARYESGADMAAGRWHRRLAELRQGGALQTLPGALGSPGYMAPEAATGDLEHVDRRSDVYSLGVILFEILTGRLPHDASTLRDYVDCVSREDAPNAGRLSPGVPQGLADLSAACLARDPSRRPVGAEKLAEGIRSWQTTSALEREVEAHMRDAAAALDAADVASGDERLRHVDRAVAGLALASSKLASRSDAHGLRERARSLRERGIGERERAGRRRFLVRVAAVLLVIGTGVALLVADRFRASSKERERLVARILNLVDLNELDRMEEEAFGFGLVLDRPGELEQATREWLGRAQGLQGRLEEHVEALAHLRRGALAQGPPWRFATREEELEERSLVEVIDRIGVRLGPHSRAVPEAQRFHDLALAVQAASSAHADAWNEAIGAAAADPRYRGLRLTPQAGLVPLGVDPRSRLLEFAHVGSGSIPARRDDGSLDLKPDAAIVLVLIPPGSFRMGAEIDPNREGYDPDAVVQGEGELAEGPPTDVVIPHAFFLAKHECTQAQWRQLTGGEEPSFFGSPLSMSRRPVEHVSWRDAERALARSGLSLPTEAEWEYGCRAGSTTRWWMGGDSKRLGEAARFAPNSRREGDRMQPPGSTWDVGELTANAFGLHDVHGNVWEWCWNTADRRHSGAVQTFASGQRPAPTDGDKRIVRGGSWYEPAEALRSTERMGSPPAYRCFLYGVRPARPLVP